MALNVFCGVHVLIQIRKFKTLDYGIALRPLSLVGLPRRTPHDPTSHSRRYRTLRNGSTALPGNSREFAVGVIEQVALFSPVIPPKGLMQASALMR